MKRGGTLKWMYQTCPARFVLYTDDDLMDNRVSADLRGLHGVCNLENSRLEGMRTRSIRLCLIALSAHASEHVSSEFAQEGEQRSLPHKRRESTNAGTLVDSRGNLIQPLFLILLRLKLRYHR
eukprot:2826279-Amphidinium_carterae.1